MSGEERKWIGGRWGWLLCGPVRLGRGCCRGKIRLNLSGDEDAYHFDSISARTFKTASLPFIFFAPRPFPNSSMILSHSSSRLLRAMQFIDTRWWESSKTELTRAVFPVPGEPEMYNVVGEASSSSPKKERANCSTASLSASRPAIWVEELLHVARSKARARAWIGRD